MSNRAPAPSQATWRSILILSFSDASRDPRVLRQIRALAPDYALTLSAFGVAGAEQVRLISLPEQSRGGRLERVRRAFALAARAHARYYRRLPHVRAAASVLNGCTYDAVICNDIETVPLAIELGLGPVVVDLHEFAPEERAESIYWCWIHAPYRRWLCAEWLPRAAASMTVSETIADRYQRDYGIRPVVVPNAPFYAPLKPIYRDDSAIRCVHHGAAVRGRGLETMLDAWKTAGCRAPLDLYLVSGDPGYREELVRKYSSVSGIRFRPPVPPRDLLRVLNQYDVGIYLLRPTNFNNYAAAPNKLYEFIQARLAVIVSPNPEMAALVKANGVGVVLCDPSPGALAQAINGLDRENIRVFKEAADRAAPELGFERWVPVVRSVVDGATGRPRTQRCTI